MEPSCAALAAVSLLLLAVSLGLLALGGKCRRLAGLAEFRLQRQIEQSREYLAAKGRVADLRHLLAKRDELLAKRENAFDDLCKMQEETARHLAAANERNRELTRHADDLAMQLAREKDQLALLRRHLVELGREEAGDRRPETGGKKMDECRRVDAYEITFRCGPKKGTTEGAEGTERCGCKGGEKGEREKGKSEE